MSYAHSIELIPAVPAAVPVQLVGATGQYGIFTTDFTPPIIEWDKTWTDSPDTEGAYLIRSQEKPPTGSGKLRIVGETSEEFWALVDKLQSTFNSMRTYKGICVWTPPNGTTVTFDVEHAEITGLPADRDMGMMRCTPEFSFDCRPYGRLDPVNIPLGTGASLLTSNDPVLRIPVKHVPGSAKALGRLKLSWAISAPTQSKRKNHLEWGYGRGDDFPEDGQIINVDTLIPLTGIADTQDDAWPADDVLRLTLQANPGAICITPVETHVGPLVVKGRFWAEGTGDIYVRMAWRANGSNWSRAGSWVKIPFKDNWCEIELRRIQVPRAITGAQSWEGRIEAYSTVPGDTLAINYLLPFPAKRYGKARTPFTIEPPDEFDASDTFPSTGALVGKALNIGGHWADGGGSGADFTVIAGGIAQRTANSDGSVIGQLVYADGTDNTTTFATMDIRCDTLNSSIAQIQILRWVDASNWIAVVKGGGPAGIVAKMVAGVYTPINSFFVSAYQVNAWYRLATFLDNHGNYYTWIGLADTFGIVYDLANPIMSGNIAEANVGGDLEEGATGFADSYTLSSGSPVRQVRNFAVWTPQQHAVVRQNDWAEIRHDCVIRGTEGGRVPYEGSYLLIDPAGEEDMESVIIAKLRRTDVETLPDTPVTDNITALLEVTPRVLLTAP